MYYPISAMPPFQSYLKDKGMSSINSISYNLSKYSICLPNGNNLDAKDVEQVCNVLKDIIEL